MKKMISLTICMMMSSAALAEATPPAKEMACRACHGVGGAKPIAPSYPKLNGQNKDYLVSSMKAYKSGARTGGLAAVMVAQMASLSDADIDALAAYYAAQK